MAILDIQAIEKILPHRYPFLLIDRILELEDMRVVGLKNVTMNEPHFTGHFPTIRRTKGVTPRSFPISPLRKAAPVPPSAAPRRCRRSSHRRVPYWPYAQQLHC